MITGRIIQPGLVLFLSVMLAASVAAQRGGQKPQRVDPMTSGIKGTVTAADTGAPIRGAEVRLSSRGSYNRLVTTDGDGLFSLTDLPAGEYRLSVSRTGFTSLLFGQRRPLEAASSIDLSEGETFTANLALTRGGAIHGRVIDQYGEPIAGTRVQALRSRMVQGRRRLQSMGLEIRLTTLAPSVCTVCRRATTM
jgi:predicted outer membrane repeat protein